MKEPQTFSELLQQPNVTKSMCLGVSLFPARGRPARVLLRLMLQQDSGRHGSQSREGFMKFGVIACVITACAFTKALTDKERAGMLTGRELPSGTFTRSLSVCNPFFLEDLFTLTGYPVLQPAPCNKMRVMTILPLKQQTRCGTITPLSWTHITVLSWSLLTIIKRYQTFPKNQVTKM